MTDTGFSSDFQSSATTSALSSYSPSASTYSSPYSSPYSSSYSSPYSSFGSSMMSPYSSYSSPYSSLGGYGSSMYGGGGGYGSMGYGGYGMGGMGGMGMGMDPYSSMMNNPAMISMQQSMMSFSRISMLLQTNFEALHMSFQSWIRLVLQFMSSRQEMGALSKQLFLSLTPVQALRLLWRRLCRFVRMCWARLRGQKFEEEKEEGEAEAEEATAAGKTSKTKKEHSSSTSTPMSTPTSTPTTNNHRSKDWISIFYAAAFISFVWTLLSRLWQWRATRSAAFR